MTQSLSRHVSRLTVGLASLLLMSAATFGSALAQTTVDAVSPAETISTTNTLVSVPVTITRTSSTPVLGFSIDFTVSPELTLPSGTGSISIGGFLSADGGATNFQVIDHGGGNYTADGVTLGLPCGSSALTGTLFSVTAGSATASGSGTVTITGVTLRDCSNAPLAASIGTSATVNIDNTLPAVAVTAPNSGEFWVVGSTHDITWTATDAAGIDAAGIDLEYSTDNGGAWTSIATSLANSGTHAWVVPNDPSTTALVRATARDVNGNSAQDASDAVFTIGYYVITVTQGTNGVIAPTGPVNVVYDGTQAFTITPDPGYHTTDVLVDGGSVGVVPGYTFNNVVADHTITATFAQNELSIDDVSVNESAGTATFTVSLNAPVPTGQTVTVDHATSDGTAAAPGDYTAITTTTLTFLPGEITKPVSVTILDDLLDEADETFTVDLSNASNATIATGTGTGTITNDDAAPSLSVDDVSVTEGDAGTVNATFTVTLSAPSGQTITVDYATNDGTATAPGDYAAITTTPLTFLPGETTKPVAVVVNGDVTNETDETFTVDLSNAANATIADAQGVGTILNDDPVPTLSVDDVAVGEAAGTAAFTVTLSAPSGQTVTVDYATADGTANAPGDYTAIPATTLTFLPGETGKPVSVTIVDDLLDEADETFTVDLSNASNATIATGTGTGTGTITDDDAAPSLSVDDVSVTEGDAGTVNATFTVTLSAPSGQTVTVDHATANGTAVAPGDYTAIATTPLTFLPGETTKPVVVVVNGDVTSEADETFTLNLTNAVNATIATGTGTGTIFNDDALGDLAAAQQTTGNDADGSTRIALTFTAPAGVAAVEVYRAGYGAYPEYDDDGGVAPPAPGAHPPSGPWTLTGVTATGQTDEPAARDFYYYVAYTQNGGGAWSPPSNVTTGSLNYHLGDVSDGITTGQGDNLVSTEDISLLGSSYGIALGALDPVGYLDVGPTTDLSVGARPTTDNVINFEDLVLFAINYGVASAPQAALAPVTATGRANALVLRAPEHVAAGGEIELELTASGNGLVQALSVGLSWDPAVVAPAGFTSGAMIDEQNGVVLSAKPGTLDAALLGRGRAGLAGEGTIARMRFRVLADGDPKFAIAALDARDGSNQKVSMAASTGVIPRPAPLTTSLSGAIPNPSRRSATIVFGLARGGPTEVSLYSVDGRRVRVLARGFREAGEYRMEWDGRDDGGRPLSPGAYFIRMVTPGAQFTRKLTFLR
jgi:hypothetical protein